MKIRGLRLSLLCGAVFLVAAPTAILAQHAASSGGSTAAAELANLLEWEEWLAAQWSEHLPKAYNDAQRKEWREWRYRELSRLAERALAFHDSHPGQATGLEAIALAHYVAYKRYAFMKRSYNEDGVERSPKEKSKVPPDEFMKSASYRRIGALADAALARGGLSPVVYAHIAAVKMSRLASIDQPSVADIVFGASGQQSEQLAGRLAEADRLMAGLEANLPNGEVDDPARHVKRAVAENFMTAFESYRVMVKWARSEDEYKDCLRRVASSKFSNVAEAAREYLAEAEAASRSAERFALEALQTPDGPYVVISEDGSMHALYAAQIQESADRRGLTVAHEKRALPVRFGDKVSVAAIGNRPSFSVTLRTPEQVADPDEVALDKNVPVFVMADSHGEYEIATELLIRHGIIDQSLTWTFGRGRLVVLGDVFDRGKHQTEILWLLYKLEHEASVAGGGVHLVLGNHEVMALTGDARYLHPRYAKSAEVLGASYADLWGMDTLLGRWLRQKPVVLKLGRTLYMHGGLSPELTGGRWSLTAINSTVRSWLKDDRPAEDARVALIIGRDGPLWYRGYFPKSSRPASATQADIDAALALYGVESIVVGHTIVPTVTLLYDGAVIAADVHMKRNEEGAIHAEGVLIEGGTWYRAKIDGTRKLLKALKIASMERSPSLSLATLATGIAGIFDRRTCKVTTGSTNPSFARISGETHESASAFEFPVVLRAKLGGPARGH